MKLTKKNITRIVVSALALILIAYTVYHIVWGSKESLKTTAAAIAVENETVVLDGIIVRDEKPVSSAFSGEVNYLVPNGSKLDAGADFAEVYSNQILGEVYSEIQALKDELEILKESNYKGIVSVRDIEELKQRTDFVYAELMLAQSRNDTEKANELKRELLICLNKKRIFDGSIKNYDSEIQTLENKIASKYAFFTGNKETLKTDESCYFYYICDGYEGEFNTQNMYSMTPGAIKGKINEIKSIGIGNTNYVGKTVIDHKWYIIAPCKNDIVSKLQEGSEYSAVFYDGEQFTMSLKLEKICNTEGDESTVILSCGTMPRGFDFDRVQTFKLEISSLRGYRVPSEAVAEVDGQKGVYVLNSSVVYFKKIVILAEYESYVIVAETNKGNENYKEYLEINDLIITQDIHKLNDGMVLKN